jgi:hypothetical protein
VQHDEVVLDILADAFDGEFVDAAILAGQLDEFREPLARAVRVLNAASSA